MSVQLIIKSAAQNVDDFKIDCEMSWTIGQIKDHITASYPTKPDKKYQKLIYGGKLLPDHLPLTSVLNPKQDLHILHLVCSVPQESENYQTKSDKKNVESTCTVPPIDSASIYPQVDQQLPTSPLFNSAPQVVNTFAVNSPADVVNQYLAMQQMYTQLMTQYLSQYNGNIPNGQVPVITPAAPQATPPQPRRNANQNAEAINVDDGVDWIDLLYIFSRSMIFFALLMYYSSPPRVIAVCALLLMLTLFSKFKRHRQRVEMYREILNRRQNVSPGADAQTDGGNTNETTDNAPAETPSDSSSTQSSQIQSALSVPSMIFSIITSFFSSLIPSDPLPVNVN